MQHIYDTTFSNFWNDIFYVSSKTRGYLEFPRELPGFLIAIVSGILIFLGDIRTTYLHKQLVDPRDLTPALSMGVFLDHLVAMSVPVLGGLLWEALGFESIFIVAAVIAIVNLIIAGRCEK